jgi:hypothetical protein
MRAAALTLIATLVLAAVAEPRRVHAADAQLIGDASIDLVIFRPLSLASFVVGCGMWVPAAFLTSPNGLDGVKTATQQFVTTPYENTFTRSLGDF